MQRTAVPPCFAALPQEAASWDADTSPRCNGHTRSGFTRLRWAGRLRGHVRRVPRVRFHLAGLSCDGGCAGYSSHPRRFIPILSPAAWFVNDFLGLWPGLWYDTEKTKGERHEAGKLERQRPAVMPDQGLSGICENEDPDVICLQETKLQPEQAVFELEGYHRYFTPPRRRAIPAPPF